MAAECDMIFFLRLTDEPDVQGTMNLGAGEQTKGRHIRFGENFSLIITDNQKNVGSECVDPLIQIQALHIKLCNTFTLGSAAIAGERSR